VASKQSLGPGSILGEYERSVPNELISVDARGQSSRASSYKNTDTTLPEEAGKKTSLSRPEFLSHLDSTIQCNKGKISVHSCQLPL
jgi:hypothetical protein